MKFPENKMNLVICSDTHTGNTSSLNRFAGKELVSFIITSKLRRFSSLSTLDLKISTTFNLTSNIIWSIKLPDSSVAQTFFHFLQYLCPKRQCFQSSRSFSVFPRDPVKFPPLRIFTVWGIQDSFSCKVWMMCSCHKISVNFCFAFPFMLAFPATGIMICDSFESLRKPLGKSTRIEIKITYDCVGYVRRLNGEYLNLF